MRSLIETTDILDLLRKTGALQEGHFLLTSGLHSSAYVQCARLLEHPARGREVGKRIAALLEQDKPDVIVSPALGGLLIGYEVASAMGLPFRFTERKEGRMKLRRGFLFRSGERASIVEDVVTTGSSCQEAAAVVERAGAEVISIAAILDRSGNENPFTVPFRPLSKLDLPTYEEDHCPLCRGGGRPQRPGSRDLS
jgi:orotate phosphoribosyltransferase